MQSGNLWAKKNDWDHDDGSHYVAVIVGSQKVSSGVERPGQGREAMRRMGVALDGVERTLGKAYVCSAIDVF